jgi:hypothetical protein
VDPERLSEIERWRKYLRECPTYGSAMDRAPEYSIVKKRLDEMGLDHGDTLVDVGAGDCAFDGFLRRDGWSGQYVPIDGSIQGLDLDSKHWSAEDLACFVPADWYVAIEVLEHCDDWRYPLRLMMERARKGVVITTPNPDVVDVLAVDPTHRSPVPRAELHRTPGMASDLVTLNARGKGDTIVAWWEKR